MKKMLLVFLFLILIPVSTLSPQTISSKSTGGMWDDVNTWVGGVVPGANNDVIINGTVIVNQTCNIKSLTINSGQTLQAHTYYGVYTINASGDVINNGIIKITPGGNTLDLLVTGNVTNNGQWDSRYLCFVGQYTQYISQGQGKFFNTTIRKRDYGNSTYATNVITASSNITLKGDFEINGVYNSAWQKGLFDMKGYTLTLASSARVLYGIVKDASHLYVTENSRLEDIEFTGDMTLHGSGRIFNSEVYFNGTVTIADTLQPYPYYSPRVNFLGNIINNGIIRSHKDGQFLDLVAWSNVHNNGIWQTRVSYFPCKNIQYISQTSGKVFSTEIYKRNYDNTSYSLVNLIAGSDLTFGSNVDLQGVINNKWEWGTLDMAGYSVNLKGQGRIYTGTVKNIPHLYMYEDSRLENVNFDGDITLHNAVRIYNSEVYFNGNVTIADTLFAYPYYNPRVNFMGNITNNGIIRPHANGNFVDLRISGNIINNGIWQPRVTYIMGTSNQTISMASGKYFEGEFQKRDHDNSGNITSQVIAGSDLNFKGVFYLNSIVNNNWGNYGVIDMKGKTLTLSGNGSIVNGTVKNATNLYVIENSWLETVTFDGDMTLRGRGRIYNNEVFFNGTVTIADTMQPYPYYSPRVNFNGNIINNGIIKWNPAGQYLEIRVAGNIINNGFWQPRITFFFGTAIQYVSQAADKYFMGEFRRRDVDDKIYSAKIIAASDLTFKDNTYFHLDGNINNVWSWGTFDMANHTLTLGNGFFFRNGYVSNPSDVVLLEKSSFESVTINGDFNLRGSGMIFNNEVVFNGNVTVLDTLQPYPYYSPSPVFKKNLINYGVIKDHFIGYNFNPIIQGNIYNYGTWKCNRTYLETLNKNDSLFGIYQTYMIFRRAEGSSSGNFYTKGSVKNLGTFELQGDVILYNNSGSELVNTGAISGNRNVVNYGKFTSTHRLDYYDPANPGLNASFNLLDRKTLENITVTFTANSGHKLMTSAVKQWWRMVPKGEVGGYSMTLKYNPAVLNGNVESELEVYSSADSGKTWKKMSTPMNITRDLVNKTITVGSSAYPLNKFGDIVLASGKPVSVPNISLAIGGRRQIRVGPPNIYTISYWNNGNTPTDKFVLQLNTNRKVHIKEIVTKDILTGNKVTVPIDTLNYDGERDELFLLVQPLASKEVRNFDVILTAEPDAVSMGKQHLEPITFTAVALWLGGAILEEYVSEVIVQGCYEIWVPVRNDQSTLEVAVNATSNSLTKAATVENGLQGIAKKGAKEVIESTSKAVVWPVFLAHDIYKCMKNTFRGMKDYVNGTHESAEIPLDKVTSWDPNEKVGPAGYGANGYMASSAPMPYTIMFENKKEATAPAWRVIIVDTLDEKVFDVSSVKFGDMSHNMGVAERNGNVLTWTFTNIELPPNVTPPQGEGWVKFVVNPKPNLPTGTQLKNKAVITFDLNKPLETNVAVNTLDFDPPKTNLISVSNVPGSRNVLLTWSIDDAAGSGAQKSSVFMASNDGPFSLVKTTDSTQAVIPVVGNVNYKFYVLSEDNVGNTEVTPSKIVDILTDVKAEDIIPTEFSLSQNYPNPFNPVTTINYSIPYTSSVKIAVYNVLGQLIKELVNEVKQTGNYKVQFSGANLSSGVYFYTINAKSLDNSSDYKTVKKLILLK